MYECSFSNIRKINHSEIASINHKALHQTTETLDYVFRAAPSDPEVLKKILKRTVLGFQRFMPA